MRAIRSKTLISVIAVFALLIFLHTLNILNPVENAAFNILSPVQKIFFDAGQRINGFIENFIYKKDLAETEILKGQIRKLLIENAGLKILAEENALLKKELGFTVRHSFETVAARAVGYDLETGSNLITLQLENINYQLENIKTDMPVIVEDGILIGKIAEIKNGQIFMRPITSANSAVAATVLNKTYTSGVAEGELNYSVIMRMIPQSENLKQGDLIVTSGLEDKMPKGLLIGTAEKIEHDAQNPFDIAYLNPLYDAKKISKVLIIRSY